MALVTKKRTHKAVKEKPRTHDQVDATYFTFLDANGDKFFQLDTYGREERAIPNKVSQSFQMDRETAAYLIKILKIEFDE